MIYSIQPWSKTISAALFLAVLSACTAVRPPVRLSTTASRQPSAVQPYLPASAFAGMSHAAILRMLPDKTWYWYWESQNRDLPSKFVIAENGQIYRLSPNIPTPSGSKIKWKLELRWVLDEGGHLLIPIDDHTLRGFYLGNGRQVGMFADKAVSH